MSLPQQPRRSPTPSRRSSPRVGVVLRVHYRNAGHLLVNYCTNLSRGGLFVPCKEPLPAGAKLTLSIAIPGEVEPAELDAEVRWVRTTDDREGPAGMGLLFKDIDGILGGRIDKVVRNFTPLQIAIISNRPPTRSHLVAQMRSLVTCEPTIHATSPQLAETVSGVDLVIVDIDSAPEEGIELLRALERLPHPPPRLALCSGSDRERRELLAPLAKIVRTPVDADDLRSCVLEAVTQIDPSEPESMSAAND